MDISNFSKAVSKAFDRAEDSGEAKILEVYKIIFRECKQSYLALTWLTNFLCNREEWYWDQYKDEYYGTEGEWYLNEPNPSELSEEYKALAKIYHKLWVKTAYWGKKNLEDEELEYFLDNATVE